MGLFKSASKVAVTVDLPANAAAEHPRTYAILTQHADKKGNVADVEGLKQVVRALNGDDAAKKIPEKGTIAFADLVEMLKAPVTEQEGNCVAWACHDTTGVLQPFGFDRRAVGPNDISLKICFAGVCHSDIHQARGEWGNSVYPMVPGHEIAGIVTAVGANVKKFAVGDRAGVGCFTDSCSKCEMCKTHNEQHCAEGCLMTYNAKDKEGTLQQGGYSTHIVVDQDYALKIPAGLPLDKAAPLLCAGITTYSPLRSYGLDKPGMTVGVVGFGGLGHMAIKYIRAMGGTPVIISHSPGKKEDAIKQGAKFVLSSDEEQMKAEAGTLNGIIDTVSANHEVTTYFPLLKPFGKYVLLGVPSAPYTLPAVPMLFQHISVGGSLIGGIKETQEMLDFSAKHNCTCDIEVIPIDKINEAYERTIASDVRYRFVIDVQGSLVHPRE
ncbi:unnamed protein product [Pedinophyceae sp. YPF-701]|nr:unnamed protein product [Pedinophyceae sp. YPF-701]